MRAAVLAADLIEGRVAFEKLTEAQALRLTGAEQHDLDRAYTVSPSERVAATNGGTLTRAQMRDLLSQEGAS
jgi:hypothetical protein